MVVDKFNMVDMEGIDIILDQGVEIPGLYQKLVESIAQCRYQCLYNWKSDGVNIPPSFVELVADPDNGNILINTGIYVTPEDVIMSDAFDAGDILYDSADTYPSGTVGAELSAQSNAIDQKADKTTYVTLSGTIVTQTGADNTMYLCGELAELTFTAPQTGMTAIRFTSGTTPTIYTFNGIKMPDDFPVTTEGESSISGTLDASTTYEINVLNGLGVWQSWT